MSNKDYKKHYYDGEFIDRFWRKVNKTDNETDCWIWIGATQSKGYGSIGIGCGRTALAHRVAFLLAFGEIPDGLCVLHKCDNRKCVNPKHLYLGTIADNNKDMVEKGRQVEGERNGRSKVNVTDVKKIRELYTSGDFTYDDLAKLFSVCPNSIRNIVKGRYWNLPLAE